MAEKLKLGEVRCSHCRKIVNIADVHCPNCGTKTNPKGKLISFLVSTFLGAIACFVVYPIVRDDIYGDIYGFLPALLNPTANIVGVICIIAAVIAAALLILNEIMRKKAFDEINKK